MSRAKIEAAFPRLKRVQYSLTSPESPHYNCIAWAVGDTHRWWWPDPRPFAFWPPSAPLEEELHAFIIAFETLGYVTCADGDTVAGYEKVAIFADSQSKPKHAAKQLPNGKWSSKLGTHEDISHSVYGLEGGNYGDVVQYLRREISQPATPQG